MAVMSKREDLGFEGAIESDTAALHGLVAAMLAAGEIQKFLLPKESVRLPGFSLAIGRASIGE